ncbi:MAG: hypothetical protein KJ592_04805 [Nanoarchaeota archaeon]|nr:hypothetical protein [Nanoarchaeota archaeon]
MGKLVSFDKTGRLYLPEEIRKQIEFRTFAMKILENGIFLEFVEEEPIEALARLGRDKLKGKSIKQLKEEARGDIIGRAKNS